MSESQMNSEAYSNAVERAVLENIILVSSSFKVSPEYVAQGDNVDRYVHEKGEDLRFDDQARLLMGRVRCRVWINKRVDG